ncbi:MAG TPA: dienelactone hydrolase family protein [Opitutaceae bacterium]|nr:dienelactone hydrolase family protein [Opitutaceae bacterium]
MPRRLLALALFALPFVCAADSPAPPPDPRGFVEKVVCRADAHQSYAVFVPTSYDPARRWPVLFCFDPRARGALPVRLFAAAAEKHGYIVAGSHSSRNGPVSDNDAAVATLLRDVSERYSIDRERVYVAGFSGGARVATRVCLAGFAKAAVVCGGGFQDHESTPPRLGFDLLGFAGSEDFNRQELLRIDRDLRDSATAHQLVIFPGDHHWLPESQTESTLAWLDARHRHAGIRARYRNFAIGLIQRRRATLAEFPAPEPYLACSALFGAAEPWLDPDALGRQRRDLLRATPDRGAARRLERRQNELIKAWLREAEFALDPGAAAATLARWRQQSHVGGAADDAFAARGALVGAVLQACHRTAVALAEGRFAPDALHWAKLAAAVQPDSPLLAYQTACVAALAGNHAEAAALLRVLLRDGVIGVGDVEREPAFADSLARSEFRELLQPPPPR